MKALTPPVFFLMGPTASGKTALAIELVQEFPFEIISVDSALIYRDMNIGTAKPTSAELSLAPHHLIDIRDPTEFYSAGDFINDAIALIDAIHARGKLPLLVGGTMLYFKALQDGMASLPKQDAAIRTKIEIEAKAVGWPVLHAKLSAIDPLAALKIKPTDSQRIQRALEVFYLTGQPLSAFHAATTPARIFNIQAFALIPEDRALLHERIDQRIDAMLQQGFVEEVIALRQKYDLNPNLPSMRAVGYRQVLEYLSTPHPNPLPQGARGLHDQILFATRQYAKRQLTWLKSWENLHRFDLGETTKLKKAIQSFLS